jgi:hypothetical protein
MTRSDVKRIVGVTAVCLLSVNWIAINITSSASLAVGQDRGPSGQEKTAAQVYKNIQVLNDLSASQLNGAMQFMSAALGVGCDHCHTNPWESDSKTAKLSARRMILMTRNINKENFSGNPAITCYTCHHGQPQTAPMAIVEPRAAQVEPEAASAKPASVPAIDEVIDRYTRAIGGAAAIENLKTLVSVGKLITTNRMTPPMTASLEIYQQPPNKFLIVTTSPPVTSYKGFNGAVGWEKDGHGQRVIEGEDLSQLKHDADFFKYLKLRESYPGMRVLGKEKIGDREAYVVGATSRDNSREKLYFDAATGLLIRRYLTFKTALGSIPEVTDFDDYKEVSGVRLPFTISWSRSPFTSTQKLAEIRVNAPVDDAKFEMPAVKQ